MKKWWYDFLKFCQTAIFRAANLSGSSHRTGFDY